MLILYGNGDFYIQGSGPNKEAQENLFYNTSKLLKIRGFPTSADLLERIPFEIYNATNNFGDDFYILLTQLPMLQYEELRLFSEKQENKITLYKIVEVLNEIGEYFIRFIECDIIKESNDIKVKKKLSNIISENKNIKNKPLPIAICAVVNQVLSGSHATLETLFKNAGATGEPPALAHSTKWKIWLKTTSDDPSTNSYQILGKILEETMEVEPLENESKSCFWLDKEYKNAHSLWIAKKQRIESVLQNNGLKYQKGGKIVETGTGLVTEALSKALDEHDFDTIYIEFNRAIETVEKDPGAAITAGCSLLEALFKTYLKEKKIDLPPKETIKPLWKLVNNELGLDPKNQTEADLQKILTGMVSVVDGTGSLRTHAGSAHGGGELRYKVKPRHARLLINSAHTLALFLIETWKERDKT